MSNLPAMHKRVNIMQTSILDRIKLFGASIMSAMLNLNKGNQMTNQNFCSRCLERPVKCKGLCAGCYNIQWQQLKKQNGECVTCGSIIAAGDKTHCDKHVQMRQKNKINVANTITIKLLGENK